MGLVMNTGSVKSQLEAMNAQLNAVIANTGKVSGDISSFRETTDRLKGETYSNARRMYGALHDPVVKRIREYAQALIRENNSYKSCISNHLSGIGYVDEDELKKDRASIKQQISYVQNVVAAQKGSYSSYLSCLQNALNLVEKKLQQIEDFKGASAGLYQGMDNYSCSVKNGIAVLNGKKFNKKTQRYEISTVEVRMAQREVGKVSRLNMVSRQQISDNEDMLDELCLDYLKENVPEILEPSYVPGMPSSVMETRRRMLEEKYVAQLKDCLSYSCPKTVEIYNSGKLIPTPAIEGYKKTLEMELSRITFFERENNQIQAIITSKNFDKDIESFQEIYEKNSDIYQRISDETGFPPELVAAMHYRESGCNFEMTIENGTGLPNGVDFETDAINVLNNWKDSYSMGEVTISDDNLAEMLEIAEKYNGVGYKNYDIESPYVYSGTNLYTEGKFASDGNFDEKLVDEQPGVYLLITSLQ